MSVRELPARASLENLRKQAKALHRAFGDGDDAAVARIHQSLPRAANLPDEDLRRLDLSLQEAQHVLAREYGQGNWDQLRAVVETGGFEDLSRLNDRETQTLLRQVSQKDLCRAIIGASPSVRGRFLSNMSRRVRSYLVEESAQMAAGDLPAHEPGASRQRLIENAETLASNGQIQWPPAAGAEPFSGDVDLSEPVADAADDPLGDVSLEALDSEEIAGIYAELAKLAGRDGLISLETLLPSGRRVNAVKEGIRLVVDGTQPDLVERILQVRTETAVRNRRVRLEMIIEGILSLQAGDNPWIIHHKMQVHYLEAGVGETPNRCREDLTGPELADWFERGWLSLKAPGDIGVTFLHLGFVARNEGLSALAPAVDAIEQPLLRSGLKRLVDQREDGELAASLTSCMEEELNSLAVKHHAAIAGLLAVQAGRSEEETRQIVLDSTG